MREWHTFVHNSPNVHAMFIKRQILKFDEGVLYAHPEAWPAEGCLVFFAGCIWSKEVQISQILSTDERHVEQKKRQVRSS